ncbi:MAG: DNA polymerase III subunit delta [Nitrospirota bacterium]|nr:MAG: DNA polymerase III subunit delta [Nitrospirota bacterium]
MKPHELHGAIRRSGLAPLYLIIGEEAFLRDEAVATLKASLVAPSHQGGDPQNGESERNEDPGFNVDVLYADETDASEILNYAQEISFFSSRRLIIVKWVEKLANRHGEALIPYLQNPNDSTTLVFVGTKLDGRLKWAQTLKKHATVVDCAPLYENQRLSWVKQQAGQLGIKLDDNASQALAETAGEGLYVTRGELDKLANYLPPSTKASAKDVEAIRGMEPGASVFDLTTAIGRGDRGRALFIVSKNLELGEAPLRILGALVWQVRRIWKAKSLIAQGTNQSQIARVLGIPPFRATEFFRQIQGWSESQCAQAWDLFWKSDAALKGGASAAPHRVLDELVLSLCAMSQKGGPKPNLARATPTPTRESSSR